MTTPTSTLLSQNRPSVASSRETDNFRSSRVNDGSATTRWASQLPGRDNEWLRINLEAKYTIDKVEIRWESAYARAYRLEVSPDGELWTPVYTNSSSSGGVETITLSPAPTGVQYIRVFCTQRATSWGYSIWEFKVYGRTPTGAIPPEPTPPTPTPTPPTPTPSGAGPSWDPAGRWSLVFDDQFASINPNWWTKGFFGEGDTGPWNGAETAGYRSSNLSIVDSPDTANGKALRMRLQTGSIRTSKGTFPNNGCALDTRGKKTFAYHAYEARMYIPGSGSQLYNWPGFWTNGNSWPTNGEFDVMETLGGQAQAHWHGPSGGPQIGQAKTFPGGWHRFGGVRKADVLQCYYDGVSIGSLSLGGNAARPADSPHFLILQNTCGQWGGPVVLPADVLVDYVKVWQPT
jgi:hypothetical protein